MPASSTSRLVQSSSGTWTKPVGPRERARARRRRVAVGQRRADAAVQREQPRDRAGAAAAPAALGRDAEALDVAARGGDPAPRALVAVAGVDEAEVELGLGRQAQVAQRGEVAVVVALLRHRHVDPVQRPLERGGERVGDADELAGVLRARRSGRARRRRSRGGSRARPRRAPCARAAAGARGCPPRTSLEPDGDRALEHRELVARVPLDRELVGAGWRRGCARPPRASAPRRPARGRPGARAPRTRSPARAASAARRGSGSPAGSRRRA